MLISEREAPQQPRLCKTCIDKTTNSQEGMQEFKGFLRK